MSFSSLELGKNSKNTYCITFLGFQPHFPLTIDFWTHRTATILNFKVKTRSNRKNDIRIRILMVKLPQKIYSHMTIDALVQKLCFQWAAILDFSIFSHFWSRDNLTYCKNGFSTLELCKNNCLFTFPQKCF